MRLRRPRKKDRGRKPQRERRVTAPQPTSRLSRRVRRRSLVATGAGVAVIAPIVAATFLIGGPDGQKATATSSGKLATVERADLVSVDTFSGTVESQAGPDVVNRLNGTITHEAKEGTAVQRGGAPFFVDGLPVLLFYGELPAWRDIGPETSDGADVKQVEENLQALGFDPGTVDDHYTSSTQAAIEDWQDSIGLAEDGVVRLGRVVFAPGALKVDQIQKPIGSPTHEGDVVMTTLSEARVVTVPVDSSSAVALQAGDEVKIVTPDGSEIAATVSSLDTTEGQGQDPEGDSTTQATVTPKRASDLSALRDGTSVDVELTDEARKDVLAVPVTALVARAGGGYAVEVVRSDGRTDFVRVTPGLYADDLVEVTGNVREGDRVVVV